MAKTVVQMLYNYNSNHGDSSFSVMSGFYKLDVEEKVLSYTTKYLLIWKQKLKEEKISRESYFSSTFSYMCFKCARLVERGVLDCPMISLECKILQSFITGST